MIVAVVVGLLGAITGEAKYERKSKTAKRQVEEFVLVGCQTLRSFVDESSGEVIRANTRLSNEECDRLSSGLGATGEYFVRIRESVQVEREVKVPGFVRDWSAEIVSRGLRLIVGAAIGALAALLALAVFARSRSIIATLSSVGRSATLSIGHVRRSVAMREGDAVLTTGSVSSPPPPQTGASKSQRQTVFDVRFNKFVTPVILSFFYVICLVAACLAGFVFWLQTILDFLQDGLGSGFIAFLWTTPLILLAVILVCLLVRLIFESVMVIFRIAEDLRRIRDK
jgi:hypothetical protein